MNEKAEHQAVRESSLGQELEEDESQVLAGIMGVRSLHNGETLVSEGESDTTLYLLIDGELAVANTLGGEEIVAYVMKKGECAGTRAFVDGTGRKATLRAIGDTTVYMLTPEAFESLLNKHPRIVYKVMRALFRTVHSHLMRMNLQSEELAHYITKTHGRY
jgi:CRP/FNR family cyclic AMP-dependent transcriptional regulator